MISATVGVGSLCLAGYADWASSVSIWVTWWARDVAGMLVIAPVVVLWASADFATFIADMLVERPGVRWHLRRGDRRGPARLQSAHRADRGPKRIGLPRRPAAAVGRAAVRPARHRDCRTHSVVLCALGHLGRRRSLRGGQSRRFLPAAAHVHGRHVGPEPRLERRRGGAKAHRSQAAAAGAESCAPCSARRSSASPRSTRRAASTGQ